MRGTLLAITITTTLAVAMAGTSHGATTPEQTCAGGKVDTAGRYFACVARAEKALVSNGDTARYDLSVSKCLVKFSDRWGTLETAAVNAGSMCPSEGDSSVILDFLDFCEQSVAVAVGGGVLPSDCLTCDGDLETCHGDLVTAGASLTNCTSSLAICDTSLSSTLTDLTTCSGSLTACSANLATCSGDLVTCSTDLASTNADLTSCLGDLTTSNADLATCESNLAACEDRPDCGDGLVADSEDCDVGNLNGATCATQPGFVGGTLACTGGCAFDTSGCYAMRFDASGETIVDHQTGLEWEKKNSAGPQGYSSCPFGPTCANPHDVDNIYQWNSGGTASAPNGGAFTDFLAKLNGSDTGICYAGHCDWRLPTPEELQSIPWPNLSEFVPDRAESYWSASTQTGNPVYAQLVSTNSGVVGFSDKTGYFVVRAVRSGS